MEHSTEIDNIKKDLRVTQDSVLLIHQDLKTMSMGIAEMASSMKIMVDVQSDMRIMNERIESRHNTQKETNARLDIRIDDVHTKIESVETQARNGNTAYSVIKWIGITFGTIACGSLFGSWLYVLSQQSNG